MDRLIIKNGRLIDPASGTDKVQDLIIMGGRVASKRAAGKAGSKTDDDGMEVIDASGMLVTPGLIDIHTHLREPGFEYKETVRSGAEAAAAGGFTTVLCMANTDPVNDNSSVTRYIVKKAEEAAVNVLPVGAVTMGLVGGALTEFADLKEYGAAALSDDGLNITDGGLMRRALEYASTIGFTIIVHAEDGAIGAGGVMNEGAVSTRLGLAGIPNASEDSIIARDIQLAELTGGRVHMAHVSTRGAVELIRAAKARGVRVTAEATPHHLVLDHGAVDGYNTNAKMSPPLRTLEDVEALRAGLRDGAIDTIATDHAPHAVQDKDVEFDAAANGIVGLETAVPLMLGLADEGVVELATVIRAMTLNPASAVGLDKGTLAVGAVADVTIIDPEAEWTVDPAKFKSKGRNTPFGGRKVKGRAAYTIRGGKVVYSADKGKGK